MTDIRRMGSDSLTTRKRESTEEVSIQRHVDTRIYFLMAAAQASYPRVLRADIRDESRQEEGTL